MNAFEVMRQYRPCFQVEFYGMFCAEIRGVIDGIRHTTELAYVSAVDVEPIRVSLPIINGELCVI